MSPSPEARGERGIESEIKWIMNVGMEERKREGRVGKIDKLIGRGREKDR